MRSEFFAFSPSLRASFHALVLAGLLISLASPVAADDGPWSLEVSGLAVQASGPFDGDSLGFGLGLEYRSSPRVGFQLNLATAELDSEIEFEFFDEVVLTGESSFRLTPVTGRLDLHLTPERRIDLYAGPVVGWLRFGDLESVVRGGPQGADFRSTTELEDQLAWGGHVGFATDLGRRTYLTGGATFLASELEAASADFDNDSEDFDFWLLELGLGIRF